MRTRSGFVVLFACLLYAKGMLALELKIDHVTVSGRDLGAMRRALEAVGVKSEYGGPHSNHATEMALTSFPDGSYLELIAIQPSADPKAVAAHYWRPWLEGNGGPTAWAVRPGDLGAEVKRLQGAGISATDPVKNGRRRPDGVALEWETSQVGPGNGTFYPFLIHDFTPRDHRAYPSGKPTTLDWTGISKVVIAVKDLNAAAGQFRRAYGFSEPQTQDDAAFGAKLAWFPGTPVVLAAPLNSTSWLVDRLRQFGESPCAFILRWTDDVRASRWFGKAVTWVDMDQLGWRLGYEVP